jgi:predicted PurR-regulated permease PerM
MMNTMASPAPSFLQSHPETRWGLNFLALFGVIIALALGKPLIMPLIVALMLAAVFYPLVELLRIRWWLPRGVAAIVVMIGLIFAMTLGIIWIVVSIQSGFQELSTYEGREMYYRRLHNRVAEDISPPLAEQLFPLHPPKVGTKLDEPPSKEKDGTSAKATAPVKTSTAPRPTAAVPLATSTATDPPKSEAIPEKLDLNQSLIFGWINKQLSMEGALLPTLIFSTFEVSMITLIVLFLMLFLWMDGEMLASRLAEVFGPRTGPYFSATYRALEEMALQVRNYIVWRTVINLAISIILGIVYSAMGLKQPWTSAIFAGVMGYIPYIGHVVGCIPAVLDGFVNVNLVIVLWILIVYGVLLLIEGYVIFPLVVGRHMEMNATTVILACLFWQLVWGNIGLFLAMPLTAGIKAICANVAILRPWANLMGQHEIMPLEEEPNGEVWPEPNGHPAAQTPLIGDAEGR